MRLTLPGLEAIIRAAVVVEGWSPAQLEREAWRPRSSRGFGLYRRIERLFGGAGGAFGSLRVDYEAPAAIADAAARRVWCRRLRPCPAVING